jgi:hypothetical protein
VEQIKSQNV